MTHPMPISGATRVYGIIADPIVQVRTPQALNEIFVEHGMDAVMVPFHVSAKNLDAFFTGVRAVKSIAGLVVTTPHKVAASRLCDTLGDAGHNVGAVNVIRRQSDGSLHGTTFDGAGFVEGLKGRGHSITGKHVFQMGAGGAGRATAFAIMDEHPASLTLCNRTYDKASELASSLQEKYRDVKISCTDSNVPIQNMDLVLNATGVGMGQDAPSPIEVSNLAEHTLVADVIASPELTTMLMRAQENGLSVHSGIHMLRAQLALIVDYFSSAT